LSDGDSAIVMVGWLMRGQDYPIGPVEPRIFDKLRQLCDARWVSLLPATAGFHECELCQFDPARMHGEVILPGEGCVYVAPRGIVHYIARHWFCPPEAFQHAVTACPPVGGMAYKQALLANGGRSLIRKAASA
jgi:hypothetical protein